MELQLRQSIQRAVFARYGLDGKYILDQHLFAMLYDTSCLRDIEDVVPDGRIRMAISQELARFLGRATDNIRPQNVLEFGAGSSSLVFARALSLAGGGRLTSVEQMPEWCADKWAAVKTVQGVDSRLVPVKLRFKVAREGVYHSYASAAQVIAERGPYDLVLVDAPQWLYGRDGSLHIAYKYLSPGALIILDDAKRSGEQWTLYRWLETYPGLQLAVFDPTFPPKGIALLRYNGDTTSRLSINAVSSSACHAFTYWRWRRRRKHTL